MRHVTHSDDMSRESLAGSSCLLLLKTVHGSAGKSVRVLADEVRD